MADERGIRYAQGFVDLLLAPSNPDKPVLVDPKILWKPPTSDTTTLLRFSGRRAVNPDDQDEIIRVRAREDLALTEAEIAALREDPRSAIDLPRINEIELGVEVISRRGGKLHPGLTLIARPDADVEFPFSPHYRSNDGIVRATMLLAAFKRGAEAPPPPPRQRQSRRG
jgi:hypothetical protein